MKSCSSVDQTGPGELPGPSPFSYPIPANLVHDDNRRAMEVSKLQLTRARQ